MAKRQREEYEGRGTQRNIEKPTGPGIPKMVKKAHWVTSTNEHESRTGETLATRSHDVIKHWADERQALPATVMGTKYSDHPGVLRFDFPTFCGERLERLSWDQWFGTFDTANLILLYQEHMRDGRRSSFFEFVNVDDQPPA